MKELERDAITKVRRERLMQEELNTLRKALFDLCDGAEGLRRCKNCKSIKLRKELVQPFNQMGWYICETCLMAGPLWMIAGYEWEGGDWRDLKNLTGLNDERCKEIIAIARLESIFNTIE